MNDLLEQSFEHYLADYTGEDIDWRAVRWVVKERIKMALRGAEQIAAIRLLDASGLSPYELAGLIGVSERTVRRIKTRLNGVEA